MLFMVIAEHGIRCIASIVMMGIIFFSLFVAISMIGILGIFAVKIYRVEKRNIYDTYRYNNNNLHNTKKKNQNHESIIILQNKKNKYKKIRKRTEEKSTTAVTYSNMSMSPISYRHDNHQSHSIKTKTDNPVMKNTSCCHDDYDDYDYDGNLFLRQNLPEELIVHICTYLPPKSVTNLACINRASRDLIDGCYDDNNNNNNNNNNYTSQTIWRSLWLRDYGTVLFRWEVSRSAFQKSLSLLSSSGSKTSCNSLSLEQRIFKAMECNDNKNHKSEKPVVRAKDFYFQFQYGYVDYVLAGHNTSKQCLFGIHGHIFDFTEFAPHHPGLSEPILLLGGGRDATTFFEDICHTKSARIIASQLCIILNRTTTTTPSKNECGLMFLPSPNTKQRTIMIEQSNTQPPKLNISNNNNILPTKFFSRTKRPPSLLHLRNRYHYGQQLAQTWANEQEKTKLSKTRKCGIRVYYDPFLQTWKGWYTDADWKPMFIDIPNIQPQQNERMIYHTKLLKILSNLKT